MFNRIGKTLAKLARAAITPAQQAAPANDAEPLTAKELAFQGRGKHGKTSPLKGNAAQVKRASTKANNIRKFNS